LNRCGKQIISLSLVCYILFSAISVHAQETLTESAEVVGTIDTPADHKIPSIKTSEWTTINLTVLDGYGLNWTRLQQIFPFQTKYLWPIIHPSWKAFLGYSSLRFEPEIISGNPRGWYTKITPNTIANADQGRTYKLVLEVKTDDIAVDYAVVVGVKVIRVEPSGKDYGMSYINVPVKASSLNNLEMTSDITTKEVAPHSFVNFDISLTNLGYYRDMFKLEFVKENGLTIATSQQIIVLSPEESQNVRIAILTEEKFFDIGTPNKITIYATSNSDPKPQLMGTIVVVTKGMYLSPLIGIVLVPIILIIVLFFLFWFFIKKRRDMEILGKPEKPWNIPEEKAYLQDLKQDDKEAYEKERKMMEDDYKSSMLWYQHYRQSLQQKPDEEKSILKKIFNIFSKKLFVLFKRPEKKPTKKEKPKKKLPILLKKPAVKPKEETVKSVVPILDTDKEKALAKIRSEQEKQLRKLK